MAFGLFVPSPLCYWETEAQRETPLVLPHPLPAPPRPPVSLWSPEQLGGWVRGPDRLTSNPAPELFLYSGTGHV